MTLKEIAEWMQKFGFLKKEEMPKKKVYDGKDIWVHFVSENGYALVSYNEEQKGLFKINLKEIE